MRKLDGSKRTRLIFFIYSVVGILGVAAVLVLLISLGGALLFSWDNAPVDPIIVVMPYAAILLVALRLALAWSVRRDRA